STPRWHVCSPRRSAPSATRDSSRRCASSWLRATSGASARVCSRSTWRPRLSARSRSSRHDPHGRVVVGYKAPMSSARRFQLDELTLRPGTYFNPQTEIMIIVDDSPEVDHEIFEGEELDSTDWVLIGEDIPIDEHHRPD